MFCLTQNSKSNLFQINWTAATSASLIIHINHHHPQHHHLTADISVQPRTTKSTLPGAAILHITCIGKGEGGHWYCMAWPRTAVYLTSLLVAKKPASIFLLPWSPYPGRYPSWTVGQTWCCTHETSSVVSMEQRWRHTPVAANNWLPTVAT